MKTTSIIVISFAALTLSCGDNNNHPDSRIIDSSPADAYCSNCPALPAIGAQIDRMGRPAVNTALHHAFDGTAAAGTAKDAYNQNNMPPPTWVTSYAATFMVTLGFLDALDTGLSCSPDAICTVDAAAAPGAGCGNQVMYNGSPFGGGAKAADSYSTIAAILADDELYLDTTIGTCEVPVTHANYLAVEFNVVTSLPNTTCGGRAPTNDVMDTSLTALSVGVAGFKVSDGSYAPVVKDNVGPHALGDGTDAQNNAFPFLGAPHS